MKQDLNMDTTEHPKCKSGFLVNVTFKLDLRLTRSQTFTSWNVNSKCWLKKSLGAATENNRWRMEHRTTLSSPVFQWLRTRCSHFKRILCCFLRAVSTVNTTRSEETCVIVGHVCASNVH